MRTASTGTIRLLLIVLLTGLTTSLHAQSVLIEAEARPAVIMVGDTSTYTVRFLNLENAPTIIPPNVVGLQFSSTPQRGYNQSIVNGRVSTETTLSWAFRPSMMGTFIIPGQVITIGKEDIRIPDVEVRVVPMDEERKSRAILHLELPEPPYYVGQALPARLLLLVRRDLTLADVNFPNNEGDSFIHSEFDNNPQRGTLEVNSRPYNGLAWDILITPIKAGPAKLEFTQDIGVQAISRDSRFPSIFSMARTRTDQMSITSEPVETDILPIPSEGRPDAFNGGVGQFKITSELSGTDLKVGEPVTLALTLSGSGNFDRISPPEFPEWEHWRRYPPKVEFTPDPEDPTGFTGSKTFEYILIPQDASITSVPELAYAWFDPEADVFKETKLPSRPVKVSPSDKPVDSSPFPLLSSETEQEVEAVPENILPLRAESSQLRPKSLSKWMDPVFLGTNLFTALVLLIIAIWQYRKNRLERDSRLARRHTGSRQVRKAMQNAKTAANQADAETFFKEAKFAVQESICHLTTTHVDAKTLVTSDCLSILSSNNVPEAVQSRILDLLNAADAHQFAGASKSGDEIQLLNDQLVEVIADLNRLAR